MLCRRVQRQRRATHHRSPAHSQVGAAISCSVIVGRKLGQQRAQRLTLLNKGQVVAQVADELTQVAVPCSLSNSSPANELATKDRSADSVPVPDPPRRRLRWIGRSGTYGAAVVPQRSCSVQYRGERLGNGGVGAEQFQQLADL